MEVNMDVTITARHCTISNGIHEETLRRVRRFDRFRARITAVHVYFDADHGQKTCEARLSMAGGPPLVARSAGPTFRDAVDQTIDRLERQLKRQRDRRRRRRSNIEFLRTA
jgi:ribosomal subunit interface protein